MTERRSDSIWVAVTPDALDVQAADDFVRHERCGAVSVFVGTTRRFTDGQETVDLEYDAYEPMAVSEMHRLAERAQSVHGAERIALHHRLGTVTVAEASVVIAVATPHRADAFTACRFLIDTLKTEVPIWKRERYADGTTEWVEGSLPEE